MPNRGLKPTGGEDGETGAGGAGDRTAAATPTPFGAEQSTGAEKSTFGGDRADRRQSESERLPGPRWAIAQVAAGSELGQDRPGKVQPKEDLRLRLVRVTVEKAGQRFELTVALPMEPRRERTGAR